MVQLPTMQPNGMMCYTNGGIPFQGFPIKAFLIMIPFPLRQAVLSIAETSLQMALKIGLFHSVTANSR